MGLVSSACAEEQPQRLGRRPRRWTIALDVEAERRKLGAMTAGELRQRYQEIGGDDGIRLATVVHVIHPTRARQESFLSPIQPEH
jgi:hypothetical protein